MAISVTYTKCVIDLIQADKNASCLSHHLESEDGSERKQDPVLQVKYDDLAADEKATWDAFWALMQSKCNAEHGF